MMMNTAPPRRIMSITRPNCFLVSVALNVFFFKQKTSYELVRSDWSSDVCSSDLLRLQVRLARVEVLQLALQTRDALLGRQIADKEREIGRASCRERVFRTV